MSPVTHFGQPLWIAVGLMAVLVALLLFWRFDRLQRRRLMAFSTARDTDSALFGVSRPLLWTKRVAFCLALLAVCLALARPLGSMQMQESERRGVDILFAIDTSRSMLTPDVKPNRLTRAKLAVEDLLDHLNGDGVGLVAFAGEAFLQAPVTNDYDAFRETLESLDTHTIALGGTDIAAAIRLSESTLALRGDTQKVMVLITDGEDLAGDALLAAQAAAKKGVIIFTVGVGTAAGDLIPVPDGAGNVQFVKDPAGNFVKSRLDADMLTQIAAATGGVYTPLGPQGQGIVTLYDERLKGFAQRQHTDRQIVVYAELFQWPVGVAIALLTLEWLLGVSVRRRVLVAAPATTALALAVFVGLGGW
jgi:Ca-activated chloride channel homolog